jgi:hypothetical protein
MTCAALSLILMLLIVGVLPAGAQFLPPQQPQQQQPQQPQQPQPVQPAPPQPAGDPRIQRLRDGLQQQGHRVLESGFEPQSQNTGPYWYAWIAAPYAQPSYNAVLKGGFDIWNVMFPIAAQDQPQTGMMTAQVWTKYAILLITSVGQYKELISALQQAQTQDAKNQVFGNFVSRIGFRVWDLERRQMVDQQDFVNKNFTR